GAGRQSSGGDGARVPSPPAGPAGTARTERAADGRATAGRSALSEPGTVAAERPCQLNVGSVQNAGGRAIFALPPAHHYLFLMLAIIPKNCLQIRWSFV